MRNDGWTWRVPLVAALALGGLQVAAAQGFQKLTKQGRADLVATCNPADAPDDLACRVDTLPGADGYAQVASRSTPVVRNGVTVGTVAEKVWQNAADSTLYIFGLQLTLNDAASDSSGLPLSVNDLFRRTQPERSVAVAYRQGVALTALHSAGRTVQGLNEYDTLPKRDDTWVDFQVDVGTARTQGTSSPSSPWLLAKTRAPKGYATNDFGLRLLNSDVANPQADAFDLFVPCWQPRGIPAPDDGDDLRRASDPQ